VEVRRHKVAYWLLRHLSVREIVEALAKQGEVNPVTNKPWSRLPIHQDCKWWREQWRKEATADIAKLQGAVLAQIREVQRQGWLHSDYSLVLKALGQERELLGLDAPTKIDIEHTIRQIALAEGLDPDEAVREAQRIINASAGRPRRARPGSGEDGAAAEEPPT
jgi:hypothetical protein